MGWPLDSTDAKDRYGLDRRSGDPLENTPLRKYDALTATVSIAPIPHLFISPVIEIGKLKGVGVESETKDIRLYTVEGRVALNPRLQLSGLFQQNSTDHSSGWNARLSLELAPLSYFYIVYNNNAVSQAAKTVDQQLITKISYLRQL